MSMWVAVMTAAIVGATSGHAFARKPDSKQVSPAPKPSAEDLALVREEWMQSRLPCNFRSKAPGAYSACLRVYVSRLPKFDPARRDHFGERYDPDRYYACRLGKAKNQSEECYIYKLRRVDSPEHWPFHKASPMKWPDAPKTSVYREGMGPIDYWRALCKAEAGEFIYRKVEKVDGLFLIRPRTPEMEGAGADRYVMEDPYGYIDAETGTLDGVAWMWVGPIETSDKGIPRFRFLEAPPLLDNILPTSRRYFDPSLFQQRPPGPVHYQRFTRERGGTKAEKLEYVFTVGAMYGVTWRGISRPFDREVGVAGGELAVVDLRTGELLGIRRGFILGARELGGRIGWGGGNVCPQYSQMPGVGQLRRRSKDIDFSVWFISKVLVPEHRIKE